MKKLMILILSLSLVYISSCKKKIDLCENKICENWGECDEEGNCQCFPEFTGVNCELSSSPKEIKINKIIVTDFPATNGSKDWDVSDAPDWYIVTLAGPMGIPGLRKTEVIENCEHGVEYEFNVDWSWGVDLPPSEIVIIDFELRDDDGFGDYNWLGPWSLFAKEYRMDRPATIDLLGFGVGLRLEVEWTFE